MARSALVACALVSVVALRRHRLDLFDALRGTVEHRLGDSRQVCFDERLTVLQVVDTLPPVALAELLPGIACPHHLHRSAGQVNFQLSYHPTIPSMSSLARKYTDCIVTARRLTHGGGSWDQYLHPSLLRSLLPQIDAGNWVRLPQQVCVSS